MTQELKLLNKYKEAGTYELEQVALKEIAEANGLSIHQTRARLVNMGIYRNKDKKAPRILKSHYVTNLADEVNKVAQLNDTEIEYLERLTVGLLKKLIKAIEK